MTAKRKPMLIITNTYLIQYILLDPIGQLLLWGENAEADKCIRILADRFEAIHRLGGGVTIGNHCETNQGGSKCFMLRSLRW